jgi:hypothetical protein
MTSPLCFTRRFAWLGRIILPVVLVTIVTAGTGDPAGRTLAQEVFGQLTPQRTSSILPDDGWRHTKMGWQKTSSWNVRPASHEVVEPTSAIGMNRYHPAAMAAWMLVVSLLALGLLPFQARTLEWKSEPSTGNSWFYFFHRGIAGTRSVKVDPNCGRSLF